MHQGDFGQLPQADIDAYRARCHEVFPHALVFLPEMPNGVVGKQTEGDKNLPVIDGGKATDAIICSEDLSDGFMHD